MRTRLPLTLAVALGLVASLALAGIAMAVETTLTAELSGSAETDEDGTGMATVVLDPDAGTACWAMSVENVEPITISHIHQGAEGEDGPVVVDLDLEGFETSSEGCNEAADPDTLQAIVDNPSGYYVNVHNEPFPGGAIRGQLTAAAESPDTALPVENRPTAFLGALIVAISAGIAFRTLRLAAVHD